MKFVTGCLALAVVLMSTPASQADFVIDDFVSAGDTGFADTTRTAIAAVGDPLNSNVVFGASGMVVSAFGIGTGVSWTLDFVSNTTGVRDVGALGYNHHLLLDGLTVSGDWTLAVVANGSGSTEPGAASYSIATGTTSTLLDLTDLVHVGNLNGINSFDFTLTKATAGLTSFTIGSMAAVPEPASIALLGLTGLTGVFVARRRRKNVETA